MQRPDIGQTIQDIGLNLDSVVKLLKTTEEKELNSQSSLNLKSKRNRNHRLDSSSPVRKKQKINIHKYQEEINDQDDSNLHEQIDNQEQSINAGQTLNEEDSVNEHESNNEQE